MYKANIYFSTSVNSNCGIMLNPNEYNIIIVDVGWLLNQSCSVNAVPYMGGCINSQWALSIRCKSDNEML